MNALLAGLAAASLAASLAAAPLANAKPRATAHPHHHHGAARRLIVSRPRPALSAQIIGVTDGGTVLVTDAGKAAAR